MAVTNINGYQIKLSDQFFFDTNIWLLLFGTIANYQQNDQASYSNFLSQIIQRNNPIFITSMIASEFCNVLLRHDFKQWQVNFPNQNLDFKKDFSITPDYTISVESTKQLLDSIFNIPNIVRVSDSYHNIDQTQIVSDFGKVDFNDSYIAQLAVTNNYKIVTNDRDFQKLLTIDILTTKI